MPKYEHFLAPQFGSSQLPIKSIYKFLYQRLKPSAMQSFICYQLSLQLVLYVKFFKAQAQSFILLLLYRILHFQIDGNFKAQALVMVADLQPFL